MWKKSFRAFLWTCLVGIGLLGGGMVFLHLPVGQRWVSNQVKAWFLSSYGAPFQAQIRYRIPDWIELQDVFIGDKQQDTLLVAGKMRVDLDIWALTQRQVVLNKIIVEEGNLRLVHDNYAFLLPSTDAPDATTASWGIQVDQIQVQRTSIHWEDSTLRASARIGQLTTGLTLPPSGGYRLTGIQLRDSHLDVSLNEVLQPESEATSPPTSPYPDFTLPYIDWREVTWSVVQTGSKGWQTTGHLAHFKAKISDLNLPERSGQIRSLQGNFPFITWGDQRIQALRLDVPEIMFSPDQQKLWVRGVGFHYPNGIHAEGGFRLENQPKAAQLTDFHVHTPHSEIRLSGRIQSSSKTIAWWDSPMDSWLVQLANPLGRMGWADVHAVYPKVLPNQQGEIRFTHTLHGTGKQIFLDDVRYEGPAGSRFQASGWLKNPMQIAQANAFFNIQELTLPDARWHAFLPESIRKAYQLPGNIRLLGTVEGNLQEAKWDVQAVTSLGKIASLGTYTLPSENLSADVQWTNLALGKLLRQDSVGLTTGQWTGQVTSLLQPNRRVEFSSTLDKASYGSRSIGDMKVEGVYQAPTFDFDVHSSQDGLRFALQTNGKLDENFQIQGQGTIQDIDLQKWAGTPSEVHLSSPISWSVQLPKFDVQRASGFLDLQTATWKKGNELIRTQPMRAEIQQDQAIKTLVWTSSWLSAELKGEYTFGGVYQEFTRFINPYFHIRPDSTLPKPQQEQWNLVAEIRSDPWLAFLSDRPVKFNPITIQGSFDSQYPDQTELGLQLAKFQLDSLKIDSWAVKIRPEQDSLKLTSEINGVEQGPLRLQKALIQLSAADDDLRFVIQVQDSVGRSIHRVGALVSQTTDAYRVALDPAGWKIYYENFQPIPNGSATLSAEGVRFDSLGLRNGPQELMIHSAATQPTRQWLIHARDISLKTWSAALLRDTTLLDGLLQADFSLLNPLDRPTYVGRIKIQDLALYQIPLGEFEGESTNPSEGMIAFNAALTGAGNQVELGGTYDLTKTTSPLKADLLLERLNAQTMQTFSQGQLRDSKGYLTGNCAVVGQIDDPQIQGKVMFHEYQTTLTAFGTTLRVDNQEIVAKNRTFLLDDFQIQDSLNNTLTVQGSILQTPENRFQYQLNAQTRDFLATNARRSDNAFFYGTTYIDATMQIRGFDAQYQIRGDVRISDKTRLTAYMPADEQVGSELNQLVQFVSPKAQKTSQIIPKKKVENSFDPSTISLNLSVSEKAELTLIMDEITGDYLKVRGNGQMTTGLDSQGDLFILGRYNVKEGTYRMTYQVFERMFTIDEASQSYITWRGSPTDADIQITASYRVNKPLATYPFSAKDLSKDPRLQRQVPFSVDLVLRGDLMAPQTTFALSMAKEYVDRQLGGEISTLLEDEGFMLVEKDRLTGRVNNPKAEANAEKIKEQAIYMLMFGRFDILGKRISGGLDAEGFARKQVSQLISDQLDRLASDIIKGVDLDVGVQSEAGANHTNRSTNVNLGVKKAFLNDRISISVGKNFELESSQRQSQEIFDQITANYNITRDGRYRFKAFRSNQYQIEGFVVETGVGFVLTLDYDDRRDIFRRSLLPKTQP